jgi:hypothetical protein
MDFSQAQRYDDLMALKEGLFVRVNGFIGEFKVTKVWTSSGDGWVSKTYQLDSPDVPESWYLEVEHFAGWEIAIFRIVDTVEVVLENGRMPQTIFHGGHTYTLDRSGDTAASDEDDGLISNLGDVAYYHYHADFDGRKQLVYLEVWPGGEMGKHVGYYLDKSEVSAFGVAERYVPHTNAGAGVGLPLPDRHREVSSYGQHGNTFDQPTFGQPPVRRPASSNDFINWWHSLPPLAQWGIIIGIIVVILLIIF